MEGIFNNLNDLLTNGFVRSRYGICCPDCVYPNENQSFYTICGIVNSLRLYESIGSELFSTCCFNLYSSLNTYLMFSEAIGGTIPNTETLFFGDNVLVRTTGSTLCENNNFMECLTSISGLCGDFSGVLDNGIVEIGTINNQSGLCWIYDYFIEQGISSGDVQDFMENIITCDGNGECGINIFCNKDEIVFGSIISILYYWDGRVINGESVPIVPMANRLN